MGEPTAEPNALVRSALARSSLARSSLARSSLACISVWIATNLIR